MRRLLPVILIGFIAVVFFWQFFAKGLLPIPSDTIIGLYHPFRDLYAKNYPNGIPFKNFLITDPVRQQYPWKELAISIEKNLELPLWNPYNFSGTPLLANFQSAVFYPLNAVFLFLPFFFSWSLFIILQPLLAGIFTYLYLQNLKLNKISSILGAVVFSFCGFSVSWLEWGTILHTALWLPLVLLSIDKILNLKTQNSKLQLKTQNFFWPFVFVFSLVSSFFAGHLQTFFYLFIVLVAYFVIRWFQFGKSKKIFLLFVSCYLLFVLLSAVQWVPTLRFILLSARNVDAASWQSEGWFIPWQNLIQFFAPDFFGNPTTLNYFGVWNYGEFIGYIGILPLVLAFFALFFRRDKKTLFFGSVFFLSLIFALPTIFAKIPFLLHIPFLETAQPTRLLFLTDFSLAILCAFGLDYFMKSKRKEIFFPLAFVGLIFVFLFGFVYLGKGVPLENVGVAKHNMVFPLALLIVSCLLFAASIVGKKYKYSSVVYYVVIIFVIFDLFRFGWKFTPFTKQEYLFPNTSVINFLQKQKGPFRIMTTDSRIFPPNFSAIYKIQSVDGYDPLYLLRYGQLIAASERGEANISPPFGFNRIITPHNFDSDIIDLLGVKYVLSLSDISSPKLEKVFEEGKTQVYENKNVFPRAFFVKNVVLEKDEKDAIKVLFENKSLLNTAVVEGVKTSQDFNVGTLEIASYKENEVLINTQNLDEGFLVLTDSFYPTWKATVDSRKTEILRTDFNFRGVVIPKGKHVVKFYDTLF